MYNSVIIVVIGADVVLIPNNGVFGVHKGPF